MLHCYTSYLNVSYKSILFPWTGFTLILYHSLWCILHTSDMLLVLLSWSQLLTVTRSKVYNSHYICIAISEIAHREIKFSSRPHRYAPVDRHLIQMYDFVAFSYSALFTMLVHWATSASGMNNVFNTYVQMVMQIGIVRGNTVWTDAISIVVEVRELAIIRKDFYKFLSNDCAFFSFLLDVPCKTGRILL